MANVEVGTLNDHLTDEEVEELVAAIDRADIGTLPEGDDTGAGTVFSGIDEDAMTEFMDRLETHELAGDVFVPLEFDGLVEAGEIRAGSLSALVDVLEEMAEDLEIEDPDDADDIDDEEELAYASEIEMLEGRLRHIWKALYEGAHQALDHNLCLIVSK